MEVAERSHSLHPALHNCAFCASPQTLSLCADWQVETRLAEVRSTVASLQAEVNGLLAEPSDDALDAELAELEKAVPTLERRLERLQGKGEGEAAVSPAEVDGLQRRLNGYLQAWKARKKGMKEILGIVAENAAKSWKEKKFCVRRGDTSAS